MQDLPATTTTVLQRRLPKGSAKPLPYQRTCCLSSRRKRRGLYHEQSSCSAAGRCVGADSMVIPEPFAPQAAPDLEVAEGTTALIASSYTGHAEAVRLLLLEG